MIRDSRLSVVLHVLLHIAEHDAPVTSEALARMIDTNPVVIRRALAGLREQGYVRSEKGHHGGWSLNRPLAEISLRDVYDAIGAPNLFAIGPRRDATDCLVEQAVNAALERSLDAAESLLLAAFSDVTLASLSASFHDRLAEHRAAHTPKDKT